MSDWRHVDEFSFTSEIRSLVWVFYTCPINTQDTYKKWNCSNDLNMIEAYMRMHGNATVTYRVSLKCADKNPKQKKIPKLMASIVDYIEV